MSEGNDLKYWLNRWDDNQIGWHMNDVNPNLIKFIGQLLGTDGPVTPGCASGKKIYVPLCGKTKDIPYLLNLGFSIFGNEASEKGIQELNEENSFGLQFNKDDSTYSTPEKKLIIYFGDFFKCPIENWGPFDCVWDRGSFIAMEYEFRTKYVEAMKRSVQDFKQQCINFRYLLETFFYDKTLFEGPPRSADYSAVVEHYGSWANVEEVFNYLIPDGHRCREKLKGEPCHVIAFLLAPKESV